jgi:hypothetical protein
MARQWVDFAVALPSNASVEIAVGDDGALRLEIDVHNDAESLVQLADALRHAVVEIDEQRALLVDGGGA